MYLEGSDQHRGWFQSSLLLSLAGNGAAPFKTVLTHGFMVDADREKISKSKQAQGGYEKPQTSEAYIKKYGADIVRLWVSSQDFRNDIIVSEERISKVAETYRVLRNALRYQLSNLFDFDPAKHTVPDDQLTGLDRWILDAFSKLETEVMADNGAYYNYEFHIVYQRISQFVAVELSAIYHDVVKDRLYTDAANSPRRRSTQTALHRIVASLCKMLAPILAFTADEAWEYVPKTGANSVHEGDWKPLEAALPEAEHLRWTGLMALRAQILAPLELSRRGGHIGKSLDAHVTLDWDEPRPILSAAEQAELKELLNVSALEVRERRPGENLDLVAGHGADLGVRTAFVRVAKAPGKKCERCWHWETDVGSHAEHPTLCARCVKVVQAGR